MIPQRSALFEHACDDLKSAAHALSRIAVELNSVAQGLETERPELLAAQAHGIAAESLRAAHAALNARAVASVLSTVARIDEATEAMGD